MKNFILYLALLLSVSIYGQFGSLSDSAEISILTIGPGKELYDKFGHSAFRVKDSLAGVDVVFNYGVYDFNSPNFYLKFARGTMMYELGVAYYRDFYYNYVAENRWIKEQVLNLNKEEKQAISDFLWINARPENKQYRYDYFFDNCATKIRDVLQETLGASLVYDYDFIDTDYSFRQLIRKNLNQNTWGSLGIDLALGAPIDRKANDEEYQFLPEYVYKSAAEAMIIKPGDARPLVKATKTVFENEPVTDSVNFFTSPLFVFSILGFVILFITIKDIRTKQRSRWLDSLIFSVTGLLGIFLLLLWLATDHTAAAYNYNMLWAFPLSILFVAAIHKTKPGKRTRKYLAMLLIFLVLLFIHWLTGVQQFATALLPLLIALTVRYGFLLRKLPDKRQH